MLRDIIMRCSNEKAVRGAWKWWRENVNNDMEEFDDALVGAYYHTEEEDAVRAVAEEDYDVDVDGWPFCHVDIESAFRDIKDDYNVGYTADGEGFWVIRQ